MLVLETQGGGGDTPRMYWKWLGCGECSGGTPSDLAVQMALREGPRVLLLLVFPQTGLLLVMRMPLQRMADLMLFVSPVSELGPMDHGPMEHDW